MNILGPESTIPKHKFLTVILAVYACISTLALLVVLITWGSKEGFPGSGTSRQNAYYYPEDLIAMGLGPWHVTNAMRLAPDKAVLAAMQYLGSKYPGNASWDVDTIELRKEFDTAWVYTITLKNLHAPKSPAEIIKVVMNGTIWEPTVKRRN